MPKWRTGTSWPSTALRWARPASAGRQVSHDLVAVEIEVDPVVRASAFGAAEEVAVELAGQRDVVHRESEVEGGQHGGIGCRGWHVDARWMTKP